jgi:hypothetical protein
VTPAKRHVTLSLYSVHGTHRRLVRRRSVAAPGGRFAIALTIRRSGSYELIARTSADAANLAASSAPVAFTV